MAVRIFNDPNTDNGLRRVVGTDYPTDEFSVTWQEFLLEDREDAFQTSVAYGPTVFNGSNNYVVFFDGSGGVAHNLAIGSDGSDTYHDTALPIVGRWIRKAARRRSLGGGQWELLYYVDLEAGTDKVTRTDISAIVGAAGHELRFGAVPWTIAEGLNGKMRSIKMWSYSRTEADLIVESASEAIATANGLTSIYGIWPCVADGNDVSGQGRHLSTQGPASEVFFDGEEGPSGTAIGAIKRGRIYYTKTFGAGGVYQ